ncbi:endonuclease/exonuclease/phosphatase family protein [Mucilaginibacter lacusdianchii]|uniref:endonuclease/exonuclease/phosphatase family protein n=1 Tax=Mucilaginibacter lacusdianchii TaxID=2684211 RepID=UPI00131CE203|nr:endonuclease/exonuclease/phosphatase family protein [Mucilaginibacter sp. JXJ CY 39]
MKIKQSIFLFIAVFMTLGSYAQTLIVGTYNLRWANPGDTGNLWVNRVPVLTSLIRFHGFDVFGTQEGLPNQLDDIKRILPEYERFGAGRDDGKDAGEHSAIFYRKDKFKVLNSGNFWLSQTPEKPSLGWDATCCNRICSWVYLQDVKSKKKFYFFNVHYDHQGVVAREESSKLILQKINSIAGKEPVILTGDFNGDHNSSWYKRVATSGLLKDTYTQAAHPYMNNGSFNDFRGNKDDEIIDHIFTTTNFKVIRWGVLTDSYHGKFPSDHFPILAEVAY